MKSYLMFLLVLSLSSFAQGQDVATKGRIILEEEEITLSDENGKKTVLLTSEKTPVGKAAIAVAQQMAFKRIGVKSMDDVEKEKLWVRFNSEMRAIMKIRKLEQPVLRFIKDGGETVKTISLFPEIIKGQTKDGAESQEGETEIINFPVLSKDGKFAGLVTRKSVRRRLGAKRSKEYDEVRLLDAHGAELFKKAYPSRHAVVGGPKPEVIVSNNGKLALIANTGVGPGGEVLQVYGVNGDFVLTYPEGDIKANPQGDIKMSPNGKYLSLIVGLPGKGNRVVFFDLISRNSWATSDKSYIVTELTDDGRAELAFQLEPIKKLDLNKLLSGKDDR